MFCGSWERIGSNPFYGTSMSKPLLGVLGGMGPLATVDFLQKLIEETPASRDQDHIPVITYSVPQMPDRPPAVTGNGESPLPHNLRT